MKTRKIGERFDFEGVTLEVVEERSCEGCFCRKSFVKCHMNTNQRLVVGFCGPHFRNDGKSVIFKEVNKV